MTKQEIITSLKSLDIKFNSKAPKAELEALLADAQRPAGEYQSEAAQKQAQSIKASFALKDRRIINLDTAEVFDSCCAAWKAGEFSSSQCDSLSGKLLGAAKRGEYPEVELKNGTRWQMFAAHDKKGKR